MCGLVGLVKKQGTVDTLQFQKTLRTIEHRGPDALSTYYDESLALGHVRLKIVDLSDESNQPMVSECGNYVLVYNGEIYNYLELREELISLGHHFKTQGDTEVLLKAYLAWGENAVSRFNGMWAFVIYDKQAKRLFGSRDRFGIKPLYYSEDAQGFYFSSEIRALLELGVSRKPNLSELQYFLLSQLTDLGRNTFFEQIHCIEPGWNFDYDLRSHHFTTSPYYNLLEAVHRIQIPPEEALEQFKQIFSDSVHLRMRADVEVGSCLSGGLDSSSVASTASLWVKQKNPDYALTAFTAVSTDPKNDESAFAKAVSDHHGMRSIHLAPTYEEFVEHLPAIVRTQEEPFGGPSIVMQYLLMKKIKESGIKVLLDGQGGDELLLGYPKYSAAYLWAVLKQEGPVSAQRKARHFIAQNHGQSFKSLFKYFIATFSPRARFRVYNQMMPIFSTRLELPEVLKSYARSATCMKRLQALECMSTNLPALLRYEDKNSMAFGIEARLPFLDHRLVELAIALPLDKKIKEGWSKWILRESMKSQLPDHVVWRKNKMGFEAPENAWLKQHAPVMLAEIQKSALLNEMISMNKLTRIFPRLNLRSQWRLYSVALWEKEFAIASYSR